MYRLKGGLPYNTDCFSYWQGTIQASYAVMRQLLLKIFFLFLLKTLIVGTRKNHLSEAVVMSTHNLCFRAKIRKNVYPCKPQFYYIKVGCKGMFVTRTCFRDVTFYQHFQISFCFNSFRNQTTACILKLNRTLWPL